MNEETFKKEIANSMATIRDWKKESDNMKVFDAISNILQKVVSYKYSFEVYGDKYEITPLFIEAYFANENGLYDGAIHACRNGEFNPKSEQVKRFLELYFHRSGRGGFDLVLSDDDTYALSILFKYCLIKKTTKDGKDSIYYCSQIKGKDVLREAFPGDEYLNVKLTVDNACNNYSFVKTCKRIGVENDKWCGTVMYPSKEFFGNDVYDESKKNCPKYNYDKLVRKFKKIENKN